MEIRGFKAGKAKHFDVPNEAKRRRGDPETFRVKRPEGKKGGTRIFQNFDAPGVLYSVEFDKVD